MADLAPVARLIDLQNDVVLSSTSNILDWEVGWSLDKVGTLTIEVGAADPGDGPLSFASALLQAAADLGSSPKPILLEFSLDGGASYDSRKLVEQPTRSLKASQRTIREDGADLASMLSTVPQERVTFTDCKLVDIFNGAAGAITPLSALGINPGPIPHLHGLLTVTPGKGTWAGRDRLEWRGVVDPAVQATATNVDIDSATTLASIETVVHRLAGALVPNDEAPQGYRGHYVADASDSALNLGGSARSIVVGNVGTVAHLTFDASGAHDQDEPFPEDSVARLHLDSATIKTDDSTIYPACNFVGGRSTAGFPDGSKITGLTVLNGTSTTAFPDDHWINGVPVIGLNVNDTSGGLYFTILDGQIRPVPGSPATACQSIAVDQGVAGTRDFALLMGTPHGIYYALNADVLDGRETWALLGDLNANVVRMQVKISPTDTAHRVVFALVKGSGERLDGVYRWTNAAGWDPILINSDLVDMIATDYQTFWVIKKADQGRIYRYGISSGEPSPHDGFALPSGKAYRLAEVVTVAVGSTPAQDSVWALVAGASAGGVYTPAYYLVYNTGTSSWGTFYNANVDGTLAGPGGVPLQLNRVVGLGITFDGQYASAFAGTDQGVYFTTHALGGALDWKSANAQGGLANYNIKGISAGEAQQILGTTLNRIFCTTEDDLLYSNSSGRWWETIKGKDRTTMGPHLSAITVSIADSNDPITGGGHSGATLPYNRIRTWGTQNSDGTEMATSPIGAAAGTHVYIPPDHDDATPKGYYWERYLDQHQDYQYRYVHQDCPFSGLHMAQLPEVQSNASVDPDRASAAVMTVARRFLPQHAVPQTQIAVQSSFATTQAALRTLRPTHKVALRGEVTITDVATSGEALATRVMDFDGSEDLWALSHSIKKGPGMTATTVTTLGTQLQETPLSESDIATGLADSIASLRVWRA